MKKYRKPFIEIEWTDDDVDTALVSLPEGEGDGEEEDPFGDW